MSKQTTEKENVRLLTPDSSNETHNKGSNLVDNIPLENGFVIRRRDNKWFTTIGDTVITKTTENYTEQLTQIDEINYELITKLIIHVIRVMKDQQEIDRMTQSGL